MEWLASPSALGSLVKKFEAGTLREDEWHHVEHLGICYWYLSRMDLLEATFKIKLGILKYNEQYAIKQTLQRGYHETITIFFIQYVRQHIEKCEKAGIPSADRLRRLVGENATFLSTLWEHYSRPLLNSQRARLTWVAPDLKPLAEEAIPS